MYVNVKLISVRLKSRRQPINTVTFYSSDTSTPLIGVVLKYTDEIRNPFYKS